MEPSRSKGKEDRQLAARMIACQKALLEAGADHFMETKYFCNVLRRNLKFGTAVSWKT